MHVGPSTRHSTLVAAFLSVVGATGLAASAILDGGAAAVAGSALALLVGAGVLLGHGFRVAFDAWPRSWIAVPALLVAAGLLGLGDAVGAFGSADLMGLPVSVGLIVVGVGLLAGTDGRLPAAGWRDRRERHRTRER